MNLISEKNSDFPSDYTFYCAFEYSLYDEDERQELSDEYRRKESDYDEISFEEDCGRAGSLVNEIKDEEFESGNTPPDKFDELKQLAKQGDIFAKVLLYDEFDEIELKEEIEKFAMTNEKNSPFAALYLAMDIYSSLTCNKKSNKNNNKDVIECLILLCICLENDYHSEEAFLLLEDILSPGGEVFELYPKTNFFGGEFRDHFLKLLQEIEHGNIDTPKNISALASTWLKGCVQNKNDKEAYKILTSWAKIDIENQEVEYEEDEEDEDDEDEGALWVGTYAVGAIEEIAEGGNSDVLAWIERELSQLSDKNIYFQHLHEKLGSFYFKAQDYSEATRHYKKIIRPEDILYHYEEIKVLAASGNQSTMSWIEELLEKSSDEYTELHLILGNSYCKEEKYKKAIDHYKHIDDASEIDKLIEIHDHSTASSYIRRITENRLSKLLVERIEDLERQVKDIINGKSKGEGPEFDAERYRQVINGEHKDKFKFTLNDYYRLTGRKKETEQEENNSIVCFEIGESSFYEDFEDAGQLYTQYLDSQEDSERSKLLRELEKTAKKDNKASVLLFLINGVLDKKVKEAAKSNTLFALVIADKLHTGPAKDFSQAIEFACVAIGDRYPSNNNDPRIDEEAISILRNIIIRNTPKDINIEEDYPHSLKLIADFFYHEKSYLHAVEYYSKISFTQSKKLKNEEDEIRSIILECISKYDYLTILKNEDAIHWLYERAKKQDYGAFSLFIQYANEELSHESLDIDAIEHLISLAKDGHRDATRWLLKNYVEHQSYSETFTWLNSAAEQGVPEAQYELGEYYEKGLGCEKDLEKAKLWKNKAVKQGYSPEPIVPPQTPWWKSIKDIIKRKTPKQVSIAELNQLIKRTVPVLTTIHNQLSKMSAKADIKVIEYFYPEHPHDINELNLKAEEIVIVYEIRELLRKREILGQEKWLPEIVKVIEYLAESKENGQKALKEFEAKGTIAGIPLNPNRLKEYVEYEDMGGYIKITGTSHYPSEYVSIPGIIDKKPVQVIGKDAFGSQVKRVQIPDEVTTIEPGAFHKCSDLEYIRLPGSIRNYGDMMSSIGEATIFWRYQD